MKIIGNILWHIPFLGFVLATMTYLLGLLLTVTVIASPIGLGLMEFGKFLFWPFGNAMVSKSDLGIKRNIAWKSYSILVRIIYFPIGLILTILNVIQIVGLFISILGIPVALVLAKSLSTYFNPINKKCVPSGVISELERRKVQTYIDQQP